MYCYNSHLIIFILPNFYKKDNYTEKDEEGEEKSRESKRKKF